MAALNRPLEEDPGDRPLCHRFCSLCIDILSKSEMLDYLTRGEDSPYGTEEKWQFHISIEAFQASADSGCHLCTLLYVRCSDYSFHWPDYLIEGQQTLVIKQGKDSLPDIFIESNHPHHSFATLNVGPKQNRDPPRKVVRRSEDERSSTSNSTASETSFELLRKWMQCCIESHDRCKLQGFFPHGRPKRVLSLSGSVDKPYMHLVPSSDLGDFEYVTLSYCWGFKKQITLTEANLVEFSKDLPVNALPQTFRDAVSISLRLGYSALWIDALCIIQDSPQDKEAEIPRMGVIYGNSALTIATLTSRGSDDGCFVHKKSLAWHGCQIVTKSGALFNIGKARTRNAATYLNLYNSRKLEDAPLLQRRGWVIQERALSPRTIYFSNLGIQFECCSMVVYEDGSDGEQVVEEKFNKGQLKSGLAHILRDFNKAETQPQAQGVYSTTQIGSWHDQWWHLIAIYSRSLLTHQLDRWPAIAGITSVFEKAADSTLVAGLWWDYIVRDLLWEAGWAMENVKRTRLDNGQPSRSWLSIDGPVNLNTFAHNLNQDRCTAEVLLNRTASGKPFLTISAPMARIPIGRDPGPDAGYDCFIFRSETPSLYEDLLQFLGQGNWTADVPIVDDGTRERRWPYEWLQREELWALAWTNDSAEVNVLIIKPVNAARKSWLRVGMFNRWRQKDFYAASSRLTCPWPRMTVELF